MSWLSGQITDLAAMYASIMALFIMDAMNNFNVGNFGLNTLLDCCIYTLSMPRSLRLRPWTAISMLLLYNRSSGGLRC